MKNRVFALVAVVSVLAIAGLATLGCSAAQKAAEKDIAKNETECAQQCAFADLDRSGEDMVKQCAVQCGEEFFTNPQNVTDIEKLFAGAQASAVNAGASLPHSNVASAKKSGAQ